MQWSPQQDNALVDVKRWLDSGGSGVYRLFGYAGTGKTTLAKHFADGLSGLTIYAAYTGKAAHVLQQKGCIGAMTIHSLIYKPAEKPKERLKELNKRYEDNVAAMKAQGKTDEEIAADPQVRQAKADLEAEIQSHRKMSFALNPESMVKDASLVVIDECSMVDQQMGDDLLSFNVPVLVLGDPAQLPPVFGSGFFTNAKPDTLLTEIHRQARDNPILRMATDVREGRKLQLGTYGDSKVIRRADVSQQEVLHADQILVGTNKTRHGCNARVRQLFGREPGLPVPGDRLVCLRNNREAGLLNGGLWNVMDSCVIDGDQMDLTIKAADSESTLAVTAHTHYFLGSEPPFWHVRQRDCFDYGNALTVHKSQGSQWDSVYLFDESRCFRADAQKHLYTGLTRAAKQVVVVID